MRPLTTALIAGLALAVPTTAPAATVSGKVVNGEGYTVVAMARDGKAQAKQLGGSGAFKVRLSRRAARGATLALVAPNGRYAGPIVLRSARRRAFLALSGRGNARLRVIKIRSGYAKVRRSLPRRAVDLGRPSRADGLGRPAGAGRLGLVSSGTPLARIAQSGDAGEPGDDADGDGLVGAYDVDDDGDRVLDGSDPNGTASGDIRGEIASSLPVDLEQSLNANAGGVTAEQIDALLSERLNLLLNFSTDPGAGLPAPVSAVDVDCLGVAWCQTAELGDPMANRSLGLWRELDENANGLPDLPAKPGESVFQAFLWPRATTTQIAPADTLEFRATTGGGAIRALATLAAYFTTVPAVKTWDDGSGPNEVSYPVAPGTPGTKGRSARLRSDKLSLTFWRPQRQAIPGAEEGTFTDMGHLYYGVDIEGTPCKAEDYSNLSSSLTTAPPSFERDDVSVLHDSADDAPVNPANTLSFRVDIGQCMRRAGMDPSGRSIVLTLRSGNDARDAAGQHLNLRLP